MWTGDSHHWVECDIVRNGYNTICIGNIGQVQRSQRMDLHNFEDGRFWYLCGASTYDKPLVVGCSSSKDKPNLLDLFQFDFTQGITPVRKSTIVHPQGSKYDLEFSPDGEHVAFLLENEVPLKDVYELLHLPTSKPSYSLWSCKWDGSAMHEIGSITSESSQMGITSSLVRPITLTWLPDGKHISFFFQWALWTVPMD